MSLRPSHVIVVRWEMLLVPLDHVGGPGHSPVREEFRHGVYRSCRVEIYGDA